VTALASHAVRAEVRFINFDFAVLEGRLALAFFGDAPADFAKDRDDRTARDTGQMCCISGV
jgi:hypothetical protein